ncbi:MAG: AMIN domain-containing protein [Deltaproteobacteria bacterium]|nr:AMIN domain-containing protein [Deltaproteobacteria bacterium]
MRFAFALLLATAAMLQPAVAGEMRELVWIGFQNSADVARVFVKTNEQVQYRVNDKAEGALILDLFDTRVQSRNHKRPLDTSQFDSPVLRIAAEELEGAARQVRIEIKLRNKVPYEVKQAGEVLSVDFKR